MSLRRWRFCEACSCSPCWWNTSRQARYHPRIKFASWPANQDCRLEALKGWLDITMKQNVRWRWTWLQVGAGLQVLKTICLSLVKQHQYRYLGGWCRKRVPLRKASGKEIALAYPLLCQPLEFLALVGWQVKLGESLLQVLQFFGQGQSRCFFQRPATAC